jgi:hypothetical protein
MEICYIRKFEEKWFKIEEKIFKYLIKIMGCYFGMKKINQIKKNLKV